MKKRKILMLVASISLLWACSENKNKLTPFAEPQEYVGNVLFESSQNVEMHFTLSADVKQITELQLTADELTLTPENASGSKDEKQEGKVSFSYSEKTSLQQNFAIKEDEGTGYNVVATDASGNPIIGSITFVGGFKSDDPAELNGGKISLSAAPLILDLTVTNACIYGTVKVELRGCGTQAVYAVFKNTTTPQEISEDIMKNLTDNNQ